LNVARVIIKEDEVGGICAWGRRGV